MCHMLQYKASTTIYEQIKFGYACLIFELHFGKIEELKVNLRGDMGYFLIFWIK